MIFKQVELSRALIRTLVERVLSSLPASTSGVFTAPERFAPADEFHVFNSNVRNTDEWKPFFEAYGAHHVLRDDTGFVVSAQEMLELFLAVQRRGRSFVGIFHTHKLLPAVFSDIDRDLHTDPDLWHLIISVRDAANPELRVFCVDNGEVHEAEISWVQDIALADA